MTSQAFNQCPVLLDSSSQCVLNTALSLEPKHCLAKQIPHSQVSLPPSTTLADSRTLLLVWVLPHSRYPTLVFSIQPFHKLVTATTYNVGMGMGTGDAEDLGDGAGAFNEMAFSIEKVTVTAKSRALKAEYSLELAQDLKAIHGLNAELNSQTFSPLRFLLRSTVKSSVPSTTLLSQAHKQMLLTAELSTSMLTPTVAGVLRSSRVLSSKSSAMLTQSHKELVEERAT